MKIMIAAVKHTMNTTHRPCEGSSCPLSSGGREPPPGVGSPLVPHTPPVPPQLELGGYATGPGSGVLHKQQSSAEKVNYWC